MKHKLFKRSRGMALAAALFFGVTAVSLGAFPGLYPRRKHRLQVKLHRRQQKRILRSQARSVPVR